MDTVTVYRMNQNIRNLSTSLKECIPTELDFSVDPKLKEQKTKRSDDIEPSSNQGLQRRNTNVQDIAWWVDFSASLKEDRSDVDGSAVSSSTGTDSLVYDLRENSDISSEDDMFSSMSLYSSSMPWGLLGGAENPLSGSAARERDPAHPGVDDSPPPSPPQSPIHSRTMASRDPIDEMETWLLDGWGSPGEVGEQLPALMDILLHPREDTVFPSQSQLAHSESSQNQDILLQDIIDDHYSADSIESTPSRPDLYPMASLSIRQDISDNEESAYGISIDSLAADMTIGHIVQLDTKAAVGGDKEEEQALQLIRSVGKEDGDNESRDEDSLYSYSYGMRMEAPDDVNKSIVWDITPQPRDDAALHSPTVPHLSDDGSESGSEYQLELDRTVDIEEVFNVSHKEGDLDVPSVSPPVFDSGQGAEVTQASFVSLDAAAVLLTMPAHQTDDVDEVSAVSPTEEFDNPITTVDGASTVNSDEALLHIATIVPVASENTDGESATHPYKDDPILPTLNEDSVSDAVLSLLLFGTHASEEPSPQSRSDESDRYSPSYDDDKEKYDRLKGLGDLSDSAVAVSEYGVSLGDRATFPGFGDAVKSGLDLEDNDAVVVSVPVAERALPPRDYRDPRCVSSFSVVVITETTVVEGDHHFDIIDTEVKDDSHNGNGVIWKNKYISDAVSTQLALDIVSEREVRYPVPLSPGNVRMDQSVSVIEEEYPISDDKKDDDNIGVSASVASPVDVEHYPTGPVKSPASVSSNVSYDSYEVASPSLEQHLSFARMSTPSTGSFTPSSKTSSSRDLSVGSDLKILSRGSTPSILPNRLVLTPPSTSPLIMIPPKSNSPTAADINLILRTENATPSEENRNHALSPGSSVGSDKNRKNSPLQSESVSSPPVYKTQEAVLDSSVYPNRPTRRPPPPITPSPSLVRYPARQDSNISSHLHSVNRSNVSHSYSSPHQSRMNTGRELFIENEIAAMRSPFTRTPTKSSPSPTEVDEKENIQDVTTTHYDDLRLHMRRVPPVPSTADTVSSVGLGHVDQSSSGRRIIQVADLVGRAVFDNETNIRPMRRPPPPRPMVNGEDTHEHSVRYAAIDTALLLSGRSGANNTDAELSGQLGGESFATENLFQACDLIRWTLTK